ncbi:MAG: RdgB/HAM1 family non-canonical purine NTP pyrophosphatase [Planctomycetes bacterium]|nr:RdgB/HAM1 family non-canonical purine NTP pyrophosphatase [Planctomycetota bacterium]
MVPGRLLLATGNVKKLRELREILIPLGRAVLAPDDLGYDPQVVEDGDTFEANAIKKAAAGLAATGVWTLADDSGIEARALGWRPGVYSARYAGEPCDDEANNRKLIAELAGEADKHVRYRCVIALARPGQAPLTWSGTFVGEHTATRRGAGGFGYDPYVLIPELGKTVAELSADEKHARSHRGQALRGFTDWLKKQGMSKAVGRPTSDVP